MQRVIATEAFTRTRLPRRPPGAHKWGVGAVVAIAGSPQYTGAAWLVCRAAGRAGAGIVFLASAGPVCQSLAPAMPEVAHIPLPELDAPVGQRATLDDLSSKIARAAAIVIGPGLSTDENAGRLLSWLFGFTSSPCGRADIGFGRSEEAGTVSACAPLFEKAVCPIVVDADALTWLSSQHEWWTRVPPGRLVLTPHAGELGRLTGEDPATLTARLEDVAESCSKAWNQTVVCKGAPSVACDGESLVIGEDAPLSLATAGSGDCFSGTIGSLISQGLSPLDAAGCAMYIGCTAARQCEAEFGVAGVIATDLPDAIARATRDVVRTTPGKDE